MFHLNKGQGLGFPATYLKFTDVLVHVVRGFEDSDIVHYCESVDPVRDVAVVNQELMMKV